MSSTPTPPITLLTTNHLALMLRSLRKRKGWTQTDLAKRLAEGQSFLTKVLAEETIDLLRNEPLSEAI